MANRAYASIWRRVFPEETLIEQWRAFLETVPFSRERPGFTELVIRAVDETEAPVLEQDLRSGEYGAAVLAGLAQEHAHADCAYETQAFWDLWTWDEANEQWTQKPQPLGIVCYGSEFNEGVWKEQGHFFVDAGFEHFFTGHAGLLGFRHARTDATRHPEEASFVAAMSQPDNLQKYQEKTRQNIRRLFDWMARVETAIPIERYQLWSEGEDNFEARVEEILATR